MIGQMELCQQDGVSFLRFPAFSQLGFVKDAFSTRLGGVSEGEYASMNLAFGRGDDPERVRENYRRFSRAVGFDENKLVSSAQDHHTQIRRVGAAQAGVGIFKPQDAPGIDGLITNEPGVTLVTHYADCVPLYFVDPVNRAIGLGHAGWRGTVAEMAQHMVEAMEQAFGSVPDDLVAAIGPSIGPCCYEVDTPVIEKVKALSYVPVERVLRPVSEEKAMLNLWELNRQIMLKAGIRPEHITVAEYAPAATMIYCFPIVRPRGIAADCVPFCKSRRRRYEGGNRILPPVSQTMRRPPDRNRRTRFLRHGSPASGGPGRATPVGGTVYQRRKGVRYDFLFRLLAGVRVLPKYPHQYPTPHWKTGDGPTTATYHGRFGGTGSP